jgi:hypothetical protein
MLRIKGGSPVVPDPGLEALEPLPPVLVYHQFIILCLSMLRIKGGSPVVPDPGLEALEPLPPVLVYHHLVFVHAHNKGRLTCCP